MPSFRMGRLTACPWFLEAVPRSAMIAVIRLHAAQADQAGPIRSDHRHEGCAFCLITDAERTATAIRLTD